MNRVFYSYSTTTNCFVPKSLYQLSAYELLKVYSLFSLIQSACNLNLAYLAAQPLLIMSTAARGHGLIDSLSILIAGS